MKRCLGLLTVILLVCCSLVGCGKKTPVPSPQLGVSVSADPATKVIAGKDGQRIARIVIKENASGSLAPNGTITFILPENTRFSDEPQLSLTAGAGIWTTATAKPTNGGREITYTMSSSASSGTAAELELANVNIDVAPNISGEIKMLIQGTAGAAGEYAVATCSQQVALKSIPLAVKIGVQNQAAGDIFITEGEADAIASYEGHKQIRLTAPKGVTFASVPKATVTGGDIKLGSIALSEDDKSVFLYTNFSSTKASTIQISNIKITVDRSVPEGDVAISVGGTALMQNDPQHFPAITDLGGIVTAKVITPTSAAQEYSTVFIVGADTYTVNGAIQNVVAHSYVKENHVFVPVRDIAKAFGIDDSRIIWDDINSRVTFLKGDKIVQFELGKNSILIDGTRISMDVSPEVLNDRIFLPADWVAKSFGGTTSWDASTKTLIIKVKV